MPYTDRSFANISARTKLNVLHNGGAVHKGIFVSATDGKLNVYSQLYEMNMSWAYADINEVVLLGEHDQNLNENGSLYTPSS